MEKLQRRLRIFIVLALLSGLATAVFVSRAHAQTSTATQLTIQDLGLGATPPTGPFGVWWDNLTDRIHLAFTFGAEKTAALELKLAAKDLYRLGKANVGAKSDALLVRYRSRVAEAAAKLAESSSANAQQQFLQTMLAHQGYLSQLLAAGDADLAAKIEATRDQNWDRLNVALKNLTPEQLAEKLNAIQVEDPTGVLRQATLLNEWQLKLAPELQAKLDDVVMTLAEKLKSLSPTQAAALAEQIRALSANPAIHEKIGRLLEGVQPSLGGLAKQLAQPLKPNQKPSTSVVPTLPTLNVAVVALTAEQLDARRRELADATTKEQLLALRQEWYGSQILYRQLYQFHHSLLDQLNAKLTKAMGKGPKPTPTQPTNPDPDAGVTPLPTQQLTPEQQAMGQAYLQSQGYSSGDIPPPAVNY